MLDELSRPLGELDESYTLHVTSPSARLIATTTVGLLRGLETFTQLVYFLPAASKEHESQRYIQDTPLLIADRPAFPHR